MIALGMVIALGALAAWSILATIALVSRDGLRPIPVDPNRLGAR